jgi:hypothetical protein
MRSRTTRWQSVRRALIYLSLIAVVPGSSTVADGPAKPAQNSDRARSAVVDKGERPIKALSTTNRPPMLHTGAEEVLPVFPKDFDWKDYSRVRAAVAELDANSDEVWPSIVEHMSDTGYCFTLRFIDSAVNCSRGDICARIAQGWIRDEYGRWMPGGDGQHFRLPANDSTALQEWCRARRDRTLVEIEIDAAEWAISTIQKEHRVAQELLDQDVSAIRERVARLRETNKPSHSGFFQPDTVGGYAEKEAAQFREPAPSDERCPLSVPVAKGRQKALVGVTRKQADILGQKGGSPSCPLQPGGTLVRVALGGGCQAVEVANIVVFRQMNEPLKFA